MSAALAWPLTSELATPAPLRAEAMRQAPGAAAAPQAPAPAQGAARGGAPAQGGGRGRPQDTEVWEPVPKMVTPAATIGAPPSDAIVLFDGTNLNEWVNQRDKSWRVGR